MQEYLMSDRKDFGDDERKAKEFSKEKYEKQKRKMPPGEIAELNHMKQNNYADVKDLSTYMDRKYLDKIKEERPDLTEVYEKLEKLMTYAEKCEAGQIVYYSISALHIGKPDVLYFNDDQNPNIIDNDKFLKFVKEDSAFANFNGHKVVSLHSMSFDYANNDRILIPIQLEKGTRMLHLGDGNVIIDKDIPMETIGVTIAIYQGKQIINWKLKQVSQQRFTELINKGEEQLNKLAGDKFGIESFNRIKLNFKSICSATALTRAKLAIQHMAYCIPDKLFKHNYDTTSHISNTKFQILFYDMEVSKDNAMGSYQIKINELHIYPMQFRYTDLELLTEFSRVIIHEFAHSLDYVVLYNTIDHSDPKIQKFSDTKEFQSNFAQEKDNLTEETSPRLYGKTNATEYFAEVFGAMFSKSSNIRILIWKQVPKTCKYITDYIDKIKPI